jgi:integrase
MSLYLRGDSKVYWMRFRSGGARIDRSTGCENVEDAKHEERKLRNEMRDEKKGGWSTITLQQAFKDYAVSTGSSGPQFDSVVKRACEHFGHQTILDDIPQHAIIAWRNGLLTTGRRVQKVGGSAGEKVTVKKGLSRLTLNHYVSVLLAVMKKAHTEWNCLKKMPVVKKFKKGKKVNRSLSREEQTALLSVSPDHLRKLLVFLFGTGARKSEALNLTWKHTRGVLDGSNQKPQVFFEKTKTDQPRWVGLPDSVSVLLRSMAAEQKEMGYTGDRVFVWRNKQGDIVPFKNPYGSFSTAIKNAGIKRDISITPHWTRHTYATRLVLKGWSLKKVATLLGHANTRMVDELYGWMTPSDLDDVVATVDD